MQVILIDFACDCENFSRLWFLVPSGAKLTLCDFELPCAMWIKRLFLPLLLFDSVSKIKNMTSVSRCDVSYKNFMWLSKFRSFIVVFFLLGQYLLLVFKPIRFFWTNSKLIEHSSNENWSKKRTEIGRELETENATGRNNVRLLTFPLDMNNKAARIGAKPYMFQLSINWSRKIYG